MLVFIDDGSTNIKLQWQESDGTIKQHISPNSFKREWAVSFGDKKVFNYTLNGEQYSFDPISPDAVVTTNIAWQYSEPLSHLPERVVRDIASVHMVWPCRLIWVLAAGTSPICA